MILRWKRRAAEPSTVGADAAARRPRFRRAVGLVVAAFLAAVPMSVAFQAPAQASVDPVPAANHHVQPVNAAMLAFWLNHNWPQGNGRNNAVFHSNTMLANGFANGGGTYGDRSRNLTNYIHQTVPGSTHVRLLFREYDGRTRPTTNTGRNAERFVYNVNYHLYFWTWDHYTTFVPMNFGTLQAPHFPSQVVCYQTTGQNRTRVRLYNAHTAMAPQNQGLGVQYTRANEQWDGLRYARVPSHLPDSNIGYSFLPYQAIRLHNNLDAICRQWTGLPHGRLH